MRDDLEARCALGIIDRREIEQHVHVGARLITQKARDVFPARRVDDDGFVAALRVRFEHVGGELLLQKLDERFGHLTQRSRRA